MKNKNIKILILIFGLIFLAAIITRGFGLFTDKETIPIGVINIPILEISENAKWYEYNIENKMAKFFIIKAKDGSIKTAFDACDVCYWQKKGYRQEGDYMICNNCGLRFPISGLGTENKTPGGCWPGYLPHIIEGDNIIIQKADLFRGGIQASNIQSNNVQNTGQVCPPGVEFCPVL